MSIHPEPDGKAARLNDQVHGMVERIGFEPMTPCLQSRCSPAELTPLVIPNGMVGRGGLEPPTSRLSGVRSNHLSYRPISCERQLVARV